MKGAVIPVSKELLASLLKLPEGVTVEVVRHSRRSRDIVSVYVEGDCLPDECAAYPPNVTRIVTPRYADNGRETTFEKFDLGGIDIGGFDESPCRDARDDAIALLNERVAELEEMAEACDDYGAERNLQT